MAAVVAALVAATLSTLVVAPAAIGAPPTVPPIVPGGNGTTAPPPPSPPPAATALDPAIVGEELVARIAELEAVESPTPEQAAALSVLRTAAGHRREAARLVEETVRLDGLAAATPQRLAELEAALAEPIASGVSASLLLAATDALVAAEAEARADLEAARTRRGEVSDRQDQRAERRRRIPEEKAAATGRLEAISGERAGIGAVAEGTGDPPVLRSAKLLALDAEQAMLQRRIESLDAEARMIEGRRDVVRNDLLLADRQVLAAERRVASVEALLAARRAAAAQEAIEQAAQDVAAAAEDHPALQSIADENRRDAERTREIAEAAAERRTTKEDLARRLQRVREDYELAQKQVEQAGLSGAVGPSLRGRRDRLPDPRVIARRLRETERELGRMLALRAEIDQRLRIADLATEAEYLIASTGPPGDRDDQALVERVRQALVDQRERYLQPLDAVLEDYVEDVLPELATDRRAVLDLTRDYADFLDRRILWVRSTDPFGLDDVRDTLEGIARLARPSTWRDVLDRGVDRAQQNIPGFALGGFAIVALVLVRRTLRRAAETAIERGDSFINGTAVHTVAALAALAGRAATIPLALALVAAAFRAMGAGDLVSGPLAAGLGRLAFALFVTELLRETFRARGVLERHLKWKTETTLRVRRTLRIVVPTVLPLVFVVHATNVPEAAELRDGVGRAAFVLEAIVVSITAALLLHPRRGFPSERVVAAPAGWTARLAFLWYPLTILLPLLLAGMSLAGWHATGIEMLSRIGETAFVLVGVAILDGVLRRAIVVGRRRLALAEAKRRQSGAAVEDPARVDVDAIGEQANSLLGLTTLSVVLISLVWLWASVIPALGILGEVTLWTETVAVAAGSEAVLRPITLLDAGRALLFVTLTWVLARNLPGLLGIVVLPRLPMSAAGRYAFSTIVRYVTVVAGIVLAFDAIGIGWSKVQFLAAAVTVGLGFGLQEIFANFVSGLIILFERPIRVGDTVTVSGVSGTVSRIQMRATTITDWDRKELVIPNKTFVTGEVVNWSLSDAILRVTVNVGVAYGSDTRLARRLLLEVADACPTVLDDPPPRAIFLAFGASSLDMSLRAFIATPDDLLRTLDLLHEAIDDAFREHGIEIAFPQQDLHLRTIDDGFVAGLARSRTTRVVDASTGADGVPAQGAIDAASSVVPASPAATPTVLPAPGDPSGRGV